MSNISNKIKYLFFITVVLAVIFILINFHDITAEEIANYTPNNYFLAFLMLMGIFAIKSVSVFIPLPVLYLSGTLIFTSQWAIIVNLFGLVVCMSLPYFIGKYATGNFIQNIFHKYPKIHKINDIKTDNEFLFVFILKVMGFIPNDISSLFLGSIKVNYFKFLLVSILVRTPMMLFTTVTGLNFLRDEEISLIVIGIIMLVSIVILYISYKKNKDKFK